MARTTRFVLAVGVAVAMLLGMVSIAHAAFPGQNGKIAYAFNGAVWTINPDGSQPTQITNGTGAAPDGSPAWSPDGSRLAFSRQRSGPNCGGSPCPTDIYIANPDGSNATLAIGNAASPAWSPDGTQLTLVAREPNSDPSVWKANLDGSGRTEVYDGTSAGDVCCIRAPAWSPTGATIIFDQAVHEFFCDPTDCWDDYLSHLFRTPASPPNTSAGTQGDYGELANWSPNGQKVVFDLPANTPDAGRIGVENADGTGRQLLTSGARADEAPAWSPDGQRIVFSRGGDGTHVMNADGTGDTRIYSEYAHDPDWQPIPFGGFPRPRGATPIRVSLVPAFSQCTASNRTHGPPLAFPSCSPPAQASNSVTVGEPTANGAAANSLGFVRIQVVVGMPGPPDDSDVNLTAHITDVRCRAGTLTCGSANTAGGADYTGELQANATIRITDRWNATSAGGGSDPATVVDLPFPVRVPCAATSGTGGNAIGGTCSVNTSANAVALGTVKDGKRAVVEVGQVHVGDGGLDGDVDTTGDNTVFMRQGVFIP